MTQSKQTASWFQRAAVWVGIGINPASITVGGRLPAILPWRPLVGIVVIGAALLAALCISQGVASRRRRSPLAKRAADTFGNRFGAPLLNLMIAMGMVGWGGFYIGVSGAGVSSLLDTAGFNWPGWLGMLFMALLVLTLSLLGITRWNALLWVTTGAAMALAIFALITVGGVVEFAPAQSSLSLRDYFWATGTVVTYGILFSLRCADFTWDLAEDRDVYKVGALFYVALVTAMLIGATLYRSTGDWNLAEILANARLAALGQLFLVVAVLAPALSSLHSGNLALSGLLNLSKRTGLLIMCAIIFLLGATRFDLQLIPFLDVVSALLPPSLVVMLALPFWPAVRLPEERRRSVALAAWLLGAAVALTFKLQGQLIHVLVGAVVTLMVLYVGLNWVRPGGGPAGSAGS